MPRRSAPRNDTAETEDGGSPSSGPAGHLPPKGEGFIRGETQRLGVKGALAAGRGQLAGNSGQFTGQNIANGRGRRILYDITNISQIDTKKKATDGDVPSPDKGRGSHVNDSLRIIYPILRKKATPKMRTENPACCRRRGGGTRSGWPRRVCTGGDQRRGGPDLGGHEEVQKSKGGKTRLPSQQGHTDLLACGHGLDDLDLTAIIGTALRAHSVRQMQRTALGACHQTGSRQLPHGAASLIASLFGYFSLRDCHVDTSLVKTAGAVIYCWLLTRPPAAWPTRPAGGRSAFCSGTSRG